MSARGLQFSKRDGIQTGINRYLQINRFLFFANFLKNRSTAEYKSLNDSPDGSLIPIFYVWSDHFWSGFSIVLNQILLSYDFPQFLWIAIIPDLLKPNSWAYNFVEVSGRNLESSQTFLFFFFFFFLFLFSVSGFSIQCLYYKPVCTGTGGAVCKGATPSVEQ